MPSLVPWPRLFHLLVLRNPGAEPRASKKKLPRTCPSLKARLEGRRTSISTHPRSTMSFNCINDHWPVESVALLRGSCAAREIDFAEVHARSFDFARTSPLSPGSILYRPAVSTAAMRVEQFLHAEGVATFYKQPDGVLFPYVAQPLLYQRAGVPIARTVPCFSTSRGLLFPTSRPSAVPAGDEDSGQLQRRGRPSRRFAAGASFTR